MAHPSTPELLALHAVRLLGFGDSGAIAERAGTSHAEVLRFLHEAQRAGWVQHTAFTDLDGWSLTDSGKTENERQLAAERARADPTDEITTVYHAFLPLNARLLRAVTDWQIKPTGTDRFAPNDHADHTWDGRVLDELAILGQQLGPLVERLFAVLSRFAGYTSRFNTALEKAKRGQYDQIDKTSVDSCHTVWFQLHEDLVATLGVDRSTQEPRQAN